MNEVIDYRVTGVDGTGLNPRTKAGLDRHARGELLGKALDAMSAQAGGPPGTLETKLEYTPIELPPELLDGRAFGIETPEVIDFKQAKK